MSFVSVSIAQRFVCPLSQELKIAFHVRLLSRLRERIEVRARGRVGVGETIRAPSSLFWVALRHDR